MFNLTDLWMGDVDSLKAAAALEQRAQAAALKGEHGEYGAPKAPRLYSRQGRVGVITIRGSLVNAENFFTELLGMSTYPAIRAALVHAAQDAEVDEILLDIESPGGAVSGVNDTAALVREVRAVKPVTAFSGDIMASAAYWIGSAANKIYASEMTVMGSIGVIATMVSVHDALKKDGVDARVIRAGKNKALGHPMEPINEKALAQVQARADAAYDVFTATVMKNRPKLKADKIGEWAEGNEFMGEDAVKAGLADGISTFDKVLAQLVVDNEKFPNNNAHQIQRGMQMKPRAALDPKLVALVAAGAELTAEQKADVEAARVAAEAAAAAEAVAAAEAEATARAAAEQAAIDKASAEAAAALAAVSAATAAPSKSELVTYLEGQVATKTDQVNALKAEKAALEEQVAAMKAPHDALVVICQNSINAMLIGLGGSKTEFAGLTAAQLVAKHEATRQTFEKQLPVGGVAATTGEASPKPAATVTYLDKARLAGARISQ